MKGFLRLGKFKTDVIEFHNHTTMVDINHQIWHSFKEILPSNYHVEFYNIEAKKIFVLDEGLLGSENNPFKYNPTNSSQETMDIMDYVQLFIVDDSPPIDRNDPQLNALFDMITSDVYDEDPLLSTILSGEFDDNAFFSTILPDEFDDALLSPLALTVPANEGISHNNISTNYTDEGNADDDIMEDNSAAENTLNPQIDSQNSTTSSNEYQLATETIDENNTQSNRIHFSRDVHPEQKHHYLSNKYKIDDGSSENGGISFVQGLKTEDEIKKKAKVLPQLRIPLLYRMMEQLNLLIYAVYEEQEKGIRIWYKNQRKGFLLHDQLNPDAEFLNPIKLIINRTEWTNNGDYELEIYMLSNKINKQSKIKQEIYHLNEEATIQIHTAEHIVSSKRKHLKPTRLLCVFEINNKPCWNTFGLSNFIQPRIPKNDQPITLSDTTTVKITLPEPKINLSTLGLPFVFELSTKNSQPLNLNDITPQPKRKKI